MEIFKTPLGELEICEMYLYYDRPLVFHCKNRIENYIALLIDGYENCERWFLIPSTLNRIEYVRAGRISLRASVEKAELGWVWEITIPYDENEDGTIKQKICSQITELDLPDENVVLSLPVRILPVEQSDPETLAKQALRDVVFLSLDNGEHSQRIKSSDLGAILLRSQGLIQTLAYKDKNSRGRIPLSIIEGTAFNFIGSYAASVGIKLEAEQPGLFSTVNDALKLIIELIEAGSNKAKLNELLPQISIRSIARYKFLLQQIAQAGVSFKLDWGSPNNGRKTAILSLDEVNQTIDLLETEGEDMSQVITLIGDLIGILEDERKKRYTFNFISTDNEQYKGDLAPNLLDCIFKVPARNIKVEIEETIEINPATNEEKISYTLVNVLDK
jgi:hypothetical protein